MREWDMFEEIIDLGKRRGFVTFGEIHSILPSEFVSEEEIEDLLTILRDIGVKIIDSVESDNEDEEEKESEKTEDLVQAYFQSMGNIAVLTKNEEQELAIKREEGNSIIQKIGFPRTGRME